MRGFACTDCQVCTHEIEEYYMVDFDLWRAVGAGRGMLCVGCLEGRLGRRLLAADFTDAPVNGPGWVRSARLASRLAAGAV